MITNTGGGVIIDSSAEGVIYVRVPNGFGDKSFPYKPGTNGFIEAIAMAKGYAIGWKAGVADMADGYVR